MNIINYNSYFKKVEWPEYDFWRWQRMPISYQRSIGDFPPWIKPLKHAKETAHLHLGSRATTCASLTSFPLYHVLRHTLHIHIHVASNKVFFSINYKNIQNEKSNLLIHLSNNLSSKIPSNTTLVWIFYSVTATCFGLSKPETETLNLT
jgi:hypothetical protein